jgi:hypothetical protein
MITNIESGLNKNYYFSLNILAYGFQNIILIWELSQSNN